MNIASLKKSLEAKGIKDEAFTLEVNGTYIIYTVYGLLESLKSTSSPEHFEVLGQTIANPQVEPKHVRMIFVDIAKALAEFHQ